MVLPISLSCAACIRQKDLGCPGLKTEMQAIMSPIFNHHALRGLTTNELELLRKTLRRSLGQESLTESDRINLHAALASVEALLRNRHTPQAPKPSAPSP